jgi:hypothetical protein
MWPKERLSGTCYNYDAVYENLDYVLNARMVSIEINVSLCD